MTKRIHTKRILISITAVSLLILPFFGILAGCATGEVTIEEDTSPEQIFQKAQEALDDNHYEEAVQYYTYFLENYPDDTSRVVAAKYELAFINYKQENLEEAQTGFKEVLSYYSAPSQAQMLPEWPKVLAQDFLAKLKTKETQEETQEANPGE